jgi:hypothetical protein
MKLEVLVNARAQLQRHRADREYACLYVAQPREVRFDAIF